MVVRSHINRNWDTQTLLQLETGLAEMATDIHKRAVILAPKLTSALANSGRVSRSGNMEYTIQFGSDRVPYARIRHFENKKNPQTLGYLSKAGDGVVRGNASKYYRNKVK